MCSKSTHAAFSQTEPSLKLELFELPFCAAIHAGLYRAERLRVVLIRTQKNRNASPELKPVSFSESAFPQLEVSQSAFPNRAFFGGHFPGRRWPSLMKHSLSWPLCMLRKTLDCRITSHLWMLLGVRSQVKIHKICKSLDEIWRVFHSWRFKDTH